MTSKKMLQIVNSMRRRVTNKHELTQLANVSTLLKDDVIRELEMEVARLRLEKRYGGRR